ncbi:MAG: peptide deformylase [Candidatus Omnitrophota bacterium]|nr:MAG: peptide deformylase [Candidatus Omnitrophota bacterium]
MKESLEIKIYPDPVLRKKSQAIRQITDEEKRLIDYMTKTMYAARGIGLAAPQVGIAKRIIVIDAGDGLLKMVNPRIITKKGTSLLEEGCLSIPEKEVEIQRAEEISVLYTDEKNNRTTKSFKGLTARAIQHEIDHLDGKLIIDYLPWFKRINEAITYGVKRCKLYGRIEGEVKCLQ